MRKSKDHKLMRGSPKSVMGEPFVASNKLAYSGHQELPIAPDVITSGTPALREALSDPELRDLRVLRGSIFYPCNPRIEGTLTMPGGFSRLYQLILLRFHLTCPESILYDSYQGCGSGRP